MKKIRTILHIQPDLAHDVKYSLFLFCFLFGLRNV